MQEPISPLANYLPALPEIILALGAMALLMFGAFRGERSGLTAYWLAIIMLLVTGILLMIMPIYEKPAFNGAFVVDEYSRFMKVLTLIGSAGAIFMSIEYMRHAKLLKFEFPVLIMLATVGMLMMISANDLMALYLGLEVQSLALYVIAAFRRDSIRSSEAGLKYFVLGALSSGMLLYGCSLIYGFTGTTSFSGIATTASSGTPNLGLIFGLVFFLAGMAFKVSAVPFHMWTPDVYEGAPTPVTAFFATAPKVAAMAMFLRTVITAFPELTQQWQQIIIFISVASMILGAFAAIGQTNIKRLMAYSSIGHMGYALVGLAAGTVAGTQAVIIYLTIYVVMNFGVFACILSMRRSDGMVEEIDELAGLSKNNPMMAFMMAMLLFSLAGIPPLAGFFGKFYVFLAAMNAKLYLLAVIGVLSSVVGAYYYLRIIKLMYFDEPADRFERVPASLNAILIISGLLVILFFAYPAPLVAMASTAAKALF